MTLDDYYKDVQRRIELSPHLSAGTFWFEALYDARPDLAELVINSPIDPFYDDLLIPRFKLWLEKVWDLDSNGEEG